jgi:crotonobetainyl-CoA:carnitine CoA-transferase CaiB-like acyl-CoA transferase
VVLAQVAWELAAPLRHGLTGAGGLLGGASPGYALYPARQGWVAVAALEPRFAEGLARELGLPELTREGLAGALLRQTAAQWEAWGRERDLPLAAVDTGCRPSPPPPVSS